jgi:hypothetical protein
MPFLSRAAMPMILLLMLIDYFAPFHIDTLFDFFAATPLMRLPWRYDTPCQDIGFVFATPRR